MKQKIYIDFEMNKRQFRPGEIIAIGATKVIDDVIVDTFHALVALQESEEIYVDIVLLTGISNFNIKNAPSFSVV